MSVFVSLSVSGLLDCLNKLMNERIYLYGLFSVRFGSMRQIIVLQWKAISFLLFSVDFLFRLSLLGNTFRKWREVIGSENEAIYINFVEMVMDNLNKEKYLNKFSIKIAASVWVAFLKFFRKYMWNVHLCLFFSSDNRKFIGDLIDLLINEY